MSSGRIELQLVGNGTIQTALGDRRQFRTVIFPTGPRGRDGAVSGSIAWTNVTGKPSTFPPSNHTHTPTEVGADPAGSAAAALAAAATDATTKANAARTGAETTAAAALTAHEGAANPHPVYVPKQRYRSFWVGAGAMTPATTAGAAPATVETATHDVAYDVFKFDGATAESVWFNLRMPDEWDRGTVKAVFYWEPDAGGSGAVTWGVSGLSDSNDDALDSAPGTEVLVSDSVIAVGDMHISAATAAVTVGGSPALGDLIAIRIRRVPSDAGDTMTQDACLIGVAIQWREGTTEPAAW